MATLETQFEDSLQFATSAIDILEIGFSFSH
jgi:hypothetical protein